MNRLVSAWLSCRVMRGVVASGVLFFLVGAPSWSLAQSSSAAKEINQIIAITVDSPDSSPAVHISTKDPVGYRYTVYDSYDPSRVVIDFPGMDVSKISSPIQIDPGLIQEVRVSSFDLSSGRLGRVELLMAAKADYNVSLNGNDFSVTFSQPAIQPAENKASADSASGVSVPEAETSEPSVSFASQEPSDTRIEPSQGKDEVQVQPTAKAKVVESVAVNPGQSIIKTDGLVDHFEHFSLGAPPRLVIDLFGVKPSFDERVINVGQEFQKIRIGTYPDKTRFVLDGGKGLLPKYSIEKEGAAIFVSWGNQITKKAVSAETPSSGTPVTIEAIDFKAEGGRSLLLLTLSGPAEVIAPEIEGNVVQFGLKNALISRALRRTIDASAFPSAVRLVTPYTVQSGKTQEVRFAVELKGPVEYSLTKNQNELTFIVEDGSFAEVAPAKVDKREIEVPAKPETKEMAPAKASASPLTANEEVPSKVNQLVEKPKYSGQKISLVFDDADIRKILQLIAEVSELNIIAGDDVKGTITLHLTDVPWDQALDLIMDIKGLGMLREGNVVRILPKETIRTMRQSELTAIKEERQLEPVQTEIVKVSYTGLANVSGACKELLTERGKITEDVRNKQLIITDVRSAIEAVRNLVTVLDTPERQVLIEARIVEASSTFNIDLGVNWGVAYDNGGDSTWGDPQFGEIGVGGNFIIPPFAPATGQAAGLGSELIFGRLGIDDVTLALRLSALETSGHGKIISNPRVTTLNGEKAKISQGTKIPYQTVSQTEIKTELVEAALSLEVEPVINPDNSVILKVKATNSTPGTTVATGAGAAPSIDTKEAETKMLLKDGETAVIGGIYVEKDDYSENGVPLLMRIPVLGRLFKSTKSNKNRSELLVFITPRII